MAGGDAAGDAEEIAEGDVVFLGGGRVKVELIFAGEGG